MSDEVTRERPALASDGEAAPPGARCLSPGQLLALQSAVPGRMPADVVAHLASCERCQRRALFGAAQATARRAEAPSLRRVFLRVGIVLAALAVVLASLKILLG